MGKNIKSRLILVVVGLTLFLFLSTGYTVQIKDHSLGVGLGIDYAGGEYEVSIQSAVPKENMSLSDDIKLVLSAKDKDINVAIKKIEENSGKYVELAHTTVLVLGKGVKDVNIIDALSSLVYKKNMPDSAALLYSQGTAKEVMQSQSGVQNLSMYALTKTIEHSYKDIATVNMSVKNFLIQSMNVESACIMPQVKLVEIEEDSVGGGQGTLSLYDIDSGAVFKDGKYVFSLDEKEVQMYNLMSGYKSKGMVKLGKNSFVIDNKSLKRKNTFDNNTPTVTINLSLEPLHPLQKDVSSEIKSGIEGLIKKLQDKDADILNVSNYFYRTSKKKFSNFKQNSRNSFFREAQFVVNVEVNSY